MMVEVRAERVDEACWMRRRVERGWMTKQAPDVGRKLGGQSLEMRARSASRYLTSVPEVNATRKYFSRQPLRRLSKGKS